MLSINTVTGELTSECFGRRSYFIWCLVGEKVRKKYYKLINKENVFKNYILRKTYSTDSPLNFHRKSTRFRGICLAFVYAIKETMKTRFT